MNVGQPRWQAAITFALVGEEVSPAPDETGRPDLDALVSVLAAADWPPARLAQHARAVIAAEQPWPHPVPAALRAGCGAAQLHAAIDGARELLELTSLEVRPPSNRSSLTADERRLLAEVPPHHVH